MSKPTPISGFPEWSPPQRMIEQYVLDRIRRTFELYGFSPLETRAVEPLDQLLRKGETSKEVYVIRRLHEEGDAPAGDDTLGLHFDLTVPFARYVLENAGKLQFPFRRYQIQKVWRGERPQEGRYREFVQADIDIVDRDTLPAHYEAEMPLVIGDALRGLPIPPVRIQVNNRKICEGFYTGIGLTDPEAALRAIDKLDKIGPAKVADLLAETAGATPAQAKACLALAEISAANASFADAIQALGVSNPLLDEGVDELVQVVETAAEHAPGLCVADLRIARGLDYYTGTVYETQLLGYEKFGSICSGGRYDNLATSGATRFPGVGISIGVTRLLGLLFGADALTISRNVPTCVLVALPNEGERNVANRIAQSLRGRGIACEVAPTAAKFGKQIRYAERRGIPYVWFPGVDGGPDQVKDIRSGDQVVGDAAAWQPPSADLHPTIG
ncbi:histidine--tRNA ligase [Melissospora conviva]|uniref:histidine--tRNA ligase n=1 Tax=Melissospora conviva TaxID=3388432 RepID=UPI003B79EDB9